MKITNQLYYEEVLKDSEPLGFSEWFEKWNGKPEDYEGTGITEHYYNERRCALVGWIAALDEKSRMDLPEFFGKRIGSRAMRFIEKYNI